MEFDTSSAGAPQSVGGRSSFLRHRSSGIQRAIVIFFFAFLTVQLLVPLAQLVWAPRPARFGWQMFSVVTGPPEFTLVRADGTTEPMDITPFVTSVRADVPLAEFLPPHICQAVPNVVAIRYRLLDRAVSETYICNA